MKKSLDVAEIESLLQAGYYINPKQAAAYLGVTVKTLADYRSFGREPEYIKHHNKVRYSSEAIRAYKQKQSTWQAKPKYSHLLSTTLEQDN